MSPGLKARCTTIHNLLPHTNKTLNKPRATHTGDHKELKHTLNTTQSLRSKQKPLQNTSTQATGFEPTRSSFQTDRRPTGFEPVPIQRNNNQINPIRQAKGFEPVPPVAPHVKRRPLYEY